MRTVDAAGLPVGPTHSPRVMGVLNVSVESPHDPSVFADAGVVRTHGVRETRDAARVGRAFRRAPLRHDGAVGAVERDVCDPGEARRHLDRIGADEDAADAAGVRTVELDGLDADRRATTADAAAATGGRRWWVGRTRSGRSPSARERRRIAASRPPSAS